MEIGEAIKAILKGRKVSVTSFAKQAGDFQSAVDRTLRGDMKMSKVVEYCEMLGYEVVVRPKRAGRREDGEYIIGPETEAIEKHKINKHVVVLEDILNGAKKRPSWYESATEEEKAKFDTQNEEKIAALKYAIDTLSDVDRLQAMSSKARKIADAIDNIIDGGE